MASPVALCARADARKERSSLAEDADLNGCTAVVTGASSGIGEATARLLSGLAASVALVARRADRLAGLTEKITADGGTALPLPADITDHDQARRVIDAAAAAFGHDRIDILINNAGVMRAGPAESVPIADWQRMVDLNLSALLYVTHAAMPHLLQAAATGHREVADLVNVGSVIHRRLRPSSGVYSATKAAVAAFSESLRQEFARRHLRVAVVHPGAVATEIRMHLGSNSVQVDMHPDGFTRLDARQIADAIGFIVTRPSQVAVNELVVRPTEQEA